MSAFPNYRQSPRLISAPNHRPPWHADRRSAQGVRSTTEGGKQEADGGKLAFIRAVQAFTCHRGGSAAFQLYSSSFSVHSTGSLVLS